MIEMALAAALFAEREYLTEVVSEPASANGSITEIASRADACAARILRAGADSGQVVLSRDLAAGIVVANSALEYRDGLVPWRTRSRVTIEAREGRFRITHSNIERLNEQSIGAQMLGATPWQPVGKWWGSGWQKAQEALQGVSAQLTTCIQAAPAQDW